MFSPFLLGFMRVCGLFSREFPNSFSIDRMGSSLDTLDRIPPFCGVSRLVFPGWRPRFLFSPRFPVGGCVKVSGGFLYKLSSNMGRSQRSPFQGGSAPFCRAGFVKQNLGWELAPPGSTLASPLSAPLPPSTYQLRRKSFAQLFREITCQQKTFSFPHQDDQL